MTENDGATASPRFPSVFFITTLFLLIPHEGWREGIYSSVFITKFQAYQGIKSQNSKVFKWVYHKIPRFLSWFITKFQGFYGLESQNSG